MKINIHLKNPGSQKQGLMTPEVMNTSALRVNRASLRGRVFYRRHRFISGSEATMDLVRLLKG